MLTWIGVALIAFGLFFVILGGLTRTLHLPASPVQPILPADRTLGSPIAQRALDRFEEAQLIDCKLRALVGDAAFDNMRAEWPVDDGRTSA